MKILAISDQVVERLYTLSSSGHFQDIELILGCGDMPFEYEEAARKFVNSPYALLRVLGHVALSDSEGSLRLF